VTTRERTRESGITKITMASGRVQYRLIVDMGKRPDGKRDQRCWTVATMAQAKAIRAKVTTGRDDGTLVRPTKITLGEVADSWLAGRRNIRPATIRSYRDSLALLQPIRHVPVQALSRAHLDGLVADLLDHGRRVGNVQRKGLSPRSVNLLLTVLGSVLDQAIQDGLVARNVARLVARPRQTKTERPTWTADQIGTLLRAVASDRLAPAWMLTTNGLRRGEVLGLTWDDVDLDAGTITIRQARTDVAGKAHHGPPKSAKGVRTLPLDPGLVAALGSLRDLQAIEAIEAGEAYAAPCSDCGGHHVVVDELGHQPRAAQSYSDRFVALVKAAGLPVYRLHDARHTSVTIMILRGVPIPVVSAWHGHATPDFTYRNYAHSQDDALSAAGRVLSGAYTGAGETL
jgi:integrase